MKFLLIIYLILMAIFSFSDLSISMAIVNETSVFAEVFDRIGYFPMLILASIAFLILAHKCYRYLFIGLSIFVTTMMVLAYGYFANGVNLVIVLFGIIVFVLENLVANYIYENYGEGAILLAKSLIYFMLMAFLITTFAKILWGRPRFRAMSDPESEFKAWYILSPFGMSDDFKSFPSGHTTQAAMIIGLMFFNDLGVIKHRKGLYLTILLWTSLVALSRVIAGAHFCSDVTTGMMISFSCYYYVKYHYFNKVIPSHTQCGRM